LLQNNLITKNTRYLVIVMLMFLMLLIPGEAYASPEQQQDVIDLVIIGQVLDAQGVPVIEAEVKAVTSQRQEPLAEAHSQEDGSWVLTFPEMPLSDLQTVVAHPHFSTQPIDLQGSS